MEGNQLSVHSLENVQISESRVDLFRDILQMSMGEEFLMDLIWLNKVLL